jgi:hypothetical protein
MPPKKKEITDALKLGVKTLIVQEVRLLRLERTFTPHFIIEAESHSIRETKRRIAGMAKAVEAKERRRLLKRILRDAVDEEIERAIQLRERKCLRCMHMRYYDQEGLPSESLPLDADRAQTVGCDRLRPELREKCEAFVEAMRANSLEDYLNEMTLLYELREFFSRFQEIWKEYLAKP